MDVDMKFTFSATTKDTNSLVETHSVPTHMILMNKIRYMDMKDIKPAVVEWLYEHVEEWSIQYDFDWATMNLTGENILFPDRKNLTITIPDLDRALLFKLTWL